MAVTQNSYTGNGTTTNYSFTFPYLKQSEIKASLDATVSTAFSIPNATTVQFNTAPANGVKIKIYRETDSDSLAATFYAGSAIKSEDLNDNFTQNLYSTQEVTERYLSNLGGTMVGDLALGEDVVVKFEGATDNANETTLTVADPTGDRTITLPDVTGTVVTTGDTGTVATGMIANDAINGTKIADDSVDSEHIAADSLDSEHYAPNSVDTTALNTDSVTTVKITDLNVTTAKIANLAVGTNQIAGDAINGGKIADDSIDSEHYVADSIDTEHYAPNSVDADALAHTSVTAGTYTATDLTVDAQGRITAASSGTIARSEIAADAIDGTKLADNAVDSEHYTDGSIDHVHLANDVIDGDNIQDDVINSEHYAAGSIDTEHIANLQVTTAKIAADAIDGTKIADNAIGSEHVSANSIGDSEIATGALDNRYYTETESDARYFNISTGDTIKDGDTFPDNDTTIATTAAINDRIIDLVDDVGGFVPIANETSFPAANPDVNNGAGTLVSIKALASNLVSNGSGVATISNGAGSGNTVTITGLANSTTYAANFGLIVETTSTLHTYAFHRQVPIATEVSTVAGSISNVNTVAGSISNVNTVASNNSNVTTVAGVSSNVTTVAGVASNVTTVAGIASNVTAVAGDATDIGAVAAKATEIGRLGTADAVADMNTLGTTAIVSDLDTCATNVSNINTAAGSISNINTVATNISNVNDFSDKYRVASSAPTSSLDTGDLYFDTSANELKVYNGSAWQGGVTATGNLAGLGANTFTGHQSLGDDVNFQVGAGDDLQLYHNGSNSYVENDTGHLLIKSDTTASNVYIRLNGNEQSAGFIKNGAVELYYDDSKKFETFAAGFRLCNNSAFTMNSDSSSIYFGADDDMQMWHSGSAGYIKNKTGDFYILANNAADNAIRVISDGAVELYYDNSKKLETSSEGVQSSGHIRIVDDKELKVGSGNDLRIFHTGGNSYIDNYTGSLFIRNNGIYLKSDAGGENFIDCSPNAEVSLFYDNSKKLETTSEGVETQGELHFKAPSSATGEQVGRLEWWNENDAGVMAKIAVDRTAGSLAPGDLVFSTSANVDTTANGGDGDITERLRITSAGDINIPVDGDKLQLGASQDLQIYHNGSANFIDSPSHEIRIRGTYVALQPNGGGEQMALGTANSSFELYYDGSKKFETTSTGVAVSAGKLVCGSVELSGGGLALSDDDKVVCGSGDDLQIYHDSNNSYIKDTGTGNLYIYSENLRIENADGSDSYIEADNGGSVTLFYDGASRVSSASFGINIIGDARWGDGRKATFGNDGLDLQIYHDGSNSTINNATGYLAINSDNTVIRSVAQETGLQYQANGAVDLYYDGSKKFETTSTGINVTGAITVNGAALGGGLSVADWYVHSQTTIDDGGSSNLGYLGGGNWTKMESASSSVTSVTSDDIGIFSFPSTGMYRIELSVDKLNNGSLRALIQKTTDNGSNWDNILYSEPWDAGGSSRFAVYFNCTNVSTHKVRIYLGRQSGSNQTAEGIQSIFQKLN